jgi:hypothetical protein
VLFSLLIAQCSLSCWLTMRCLKLEAGSKGAVDGCADQSSFKCWYGLRERSWLAVGYGVSGWSHMAHGSTLFAAPGQSGLHHTWQHPVCCTGAIRPTPHLAAPCLLHRGNHAYTTPGSTLFAAPGQSCLAAPCLLHRGNHAWQYQMYLWWSCKRSARLLVHKPSFWHALLILTTCSSAFFQCC